MHDARELHVAICALTFHRPGGLESLLDGLQSLDLPAGATLRVVIVDNDPLGSGGPVVERLRERFHFPVHYEIETRRGIPFGRNRAVAIALDHGADFVAFIDDDERPDPDWLEALLRTQRATGADVVTGPVQPVFESEPAPWVVQGRFYERPRFATGTEIGYARTSNVLIARHLLPPKGHAFNEAMGLNGGDDTHFFMRARMHGARIVWADDAWVSEVVPDSRVSTRWLLRREYRRGNTLSLCLRDLEDSPWRRVRRVGNAVLQVLRGVASLIGAPVRGRHHAVKGLQSCAFGAGLVTGLTGRTYEEYATIHGS